MSRDAAIVPYVIGGSVLVQTVDATAIATALPAIARNFNADPVTASLAITAYFIGMALSVPASGWLADRFGGRNVFRVACLVLMAASLVCAAAPTLAILVGARFVGGAASSVMLPIGRLMVIRSAPPHQIMERVTTFATIGLIGPIIGPVLGGFFVQSLSWRAIFGMVVVLGAAASVALTLATVDDRQEQPHSLDVPGLLISGSGLALLVGGMELVGHGIEPALGCALLAAGSLLLAGLFVHARRAAQPLIRVDLLGRRLLRISILSDFAMRMLITASPMVVSLLLQVGLHQKPLVAGSLLLAPAVGNIAVKPAVALAARTIGLPRAMAAGAILSSLSFASLVMFGPHAWMPAIFLPLALHGLGRAIVVNSGTVLNFTGMRTEEMGLVTGLTSLFQQVAMVVGVGLASLLLRLCTTSVLDLAAIREVVLLMSGVSLLSLVALAARCEDMDRA